MTPEQQSVLDELLSQNPDELPPPIAARKGPVDLLASLGIAGPAPSPVPPPEAAPESPAGLPPPIARQAPQAPRDVAPPWLDPIPQRPVPERVVDRPGSTAGRRAHKAIGAILAPITGRNSYVDRVRRENALGDQRYKDALTEYQLQREADVQGRAQQMDAMPIPDHLVREYGLPQGTTYGQLKQYQQMGYGTLVRQREGAGDALELEGKRQEGREGLEGLKQDDRLELERLRQQGRMRAGRLAAANGEGTVWSKVGPDGQAAIEGYYMGDMSTEAQTAPARYGDRFSSKMWTLWGQERQRNMMARKSREEKRGKTALESAGARAALGTMHKWLQDNPGRMGPVLQRIKTAGISGQLGDDELGNMAAAFQSRLIALAANFIASKGGKAITESERDLIAGRAGSAIEGSSIGPSVVSVIEKIAKRQITKEQDIVDFIAMIDKELRERNRTLATGPEGPRTMWDSGDRLEAGKTVIEAWKQEHPGEDPPSLVSPTATNSLWRVRWRDGRTEEFRMR